MLSPKQQEEMIIILFYNLFLDCSQSGISQYSRNLIRRLQPRKEVTSPKEEKPRSLSREMARPLPGQGRGYASITTEEGPTPVAVRHYSLAAVHLLCPLDDSNNQQRANVRLWGYLYASPRTSTYSS